MLTKPTALGTLAVIVAARGSLPTVRVSSAQSSTPYNYWGVARGEIRARKRDGILTCISTERAASDRRSERLANLDLDRVAQREHRVCCQQLGPLTEQQADRVLSDLGI